MLRYADAIVKRGVDKLIDAIAHSQEPQSKCYCFLIHDVQGLNGVALMFLRAHGRQYMSVCLEALLFLCPFVLIVALAANLTTHKPRNATIS